MNCHCEQCVQDLPLPRMDSFLYLCSSPEALISPSSGSHGINCPIYFCTFNVFILESVNVKSLNTTTLLQPCNPISFSCYLGTCLLTIFNAALLVFSVFVLGYHFTLSLFLDNSILCPGFIYHLQN